MKIFVLSFGLFFNSLHFAQLQIQLLWQEKSFELDQSNALNDSLQIQVSEFKFYLQGQERNLQNYYYLIDASDKGSLTLTEKLNACQVGLSPTIQISSEFTGALDPINGMYWAWNTGFISVKCVGELVNIHTKRLQHFEFHLGGYQAPFACFYPLTNIGTALQIHLDQWFKQIFQDKQYTTQIMRPCREGTEIFNLFVSTISHAP
jgi:hypothetical protein